MEKYLILGLDIGGTKTCCLVGDYQGKIYNRIEFPTRAMRSGDEIFDDICRRAEELLGDYRIVSVSVSIGGPLNLKRGELLNPPHLPGWKGYPLRNRLEKRFGIPVFIEHDGNAGALAEWYFGHGRGVSNLIFITHGTGFGAGLILDGKLYSGTTSLAGEIGHVRIADDGPEAFGKKGSVESFCAGLGIKLLARKMYPEKYSGIIEARPVIEDYLAGKAEALRIMDVSANFTGKAIAILIDLFNPEVIVLGSLSYRLGEAYLRRVREVAGEESLPMAFQACRILTTSFGSAVGDVAALMAAIHYKKNPK